MAGFTSANVTISQVRLQSHGGVKRNLFRVALVTGAEVYTTGGLFMPGFEQWGMVRNLDSLNILGSVTQTGIQWKWDQLLNTFRGYIQVTAEVTAGTAGGAVFKEFSTDVTPSGITWYVEATGW